MKMTRYRSLFSALALSLLASAAVLVSSPAAQAAGEITDPSFELNTGWTYADSVYDTPRCTVAECGSGGNTAAPKTGVAWLWFGGAATAGHTGTAEQTITLPAAIPTSAFVYNLRVGVYGATANATLIVTYDGVEIDRVDPTHNQAVTTAYIERVRPLPAQTAGTHVIKFAYANPAGVSTNISVDDVSIATPPAAPVITTSTPASGSTSLAPILSGTAAASTTVSIYSGASCAGTALATGTAAAFTTPGLPVTAVVGANTYSAKAVNATSLSSVCSAPFTYTATPVTVPPPPVPPVVVPDTKITKAPKKASFAKKATIKFTSTVAGSTFMCKVDNKAFKACSSPLKLKNLKVGKHKVTIYAVAAGQTDPTPAVVKFKVKKKKK